MSRGLGFGVEPFFEQRLRLAAVAIGIVFGIFFLRLFQLQVLQRGDLMQRSQRNSIRTVRLEAPRGEILDRHGRVLATTRTAFDLEVIPSELQRPERTFRVLARLVEQEPEVLRESFGAPRGRARFQPVRLVEDLSWPQLARVETHLYAIPGALTEVRPQRHYPDAGLLGHLLGTVGEVRAEQLETRRFADYRAGELVGQSGIEALLEPHLRGRAGGRNVVVDVAGREVELLDEVEPLPGGRTHLTLDVDLQRAADEGFDAVAERDDGLVSGAAVAMDARSGEILVLLSRPRFDPNAFTGSLDPESWRALREDPQKPLQNRALAGQYPPGSTWKTFVAAAALADGTIDPRARVWCPGHFRLGRRTYRCWKREGHGAVDLHEALVRSCDVYFYQTGLEIGVDRLAEYARAFGFGRATGIALANEQPGLVPTRAWKLRRFGEPWVRGETVSAAIGQGFNLATPLQLAVAYAAVANGGRVLRPRIVLRLEGRDGTVAGEPAQVTERLPVGPKHLERIRRALAAVVNERGGTGGRSRVAGVEVAGKTGTAQVVRLKYTEGMEEGRIPRRYRDHAWFAAFAPAEDAEIAVAVLVEHGGHGGSTAAPIAQRILQRYFEKSRGEEPPERREARLGAPASGDDRAAP